MPLKPKQSLAKSSDISSYPSLLAQVREEFASLEFFVKSRTVQGYWQVGKFIHEHLLHHEDRADYGHHLFARLGKDIDKDESTLRKIVKFYRTYPILAARPELTWNHFLALMTVKDKNEQFSTLRLLFPNSNLLKAANRPHRGGLGMTESASFAGAFKRTRKYCELERSSASSHIQRVAANGLPC